MDFKVSFLQLFAYYNHVNTFRWFWYWFNVWVWSTPESVTHKWCQNVAVIITNFDTSLPIVKPKLFLLNTKKSPRNVPNGSSKNVDAMSEKNKILITWGQKSLMLLPFQSLSQKSQESGWWNDWNFSGKRLSYGCSSAFFCAAVRVGFSGVKIGSSKQIF